MTDNEKVRTLIDIPADGNYIEILGHRIDGFESFEAFLEHLKKYAELEETVNHQKAEIERLKTENKDISEQFRILDVECERLEKANEKQKTEIERLNSPYEMQVEASKKLENSIKAEAVKEFAERLKDRPRKHLLLRPDSYYKQYVRVTDIDNLVKEMVGEN